ncbi:hypothetical protein ACQR2B_06605 [Bradyrhizobium oligotrophicum]|uniref:hypothetical protein n=1 Tax=Bradyrhizobium TaxID=374 RepID=UPI003EBB8D6C
MPDYAGAEDAIGARLTAQWVDGATPKSLIVFGNKRPDPPFPPIDAATGNPAPFLICEVVGTSSKPHTFGAPGNRFFRYDGLIILHALVAIDEGKARATRYAVDASEIFRAATFYTDANGSYVRTIAPYPPDGGGSAEVEGVAAGSLYRVTATTPFEYFHRA